MLYGHAEAIEHRNEMGGHSAVWATRAQREGCEVYTAVQTSKTIQAELVVDSEKL